MSFFGQLRRCRALRAKGLASFAGLVVVVAGVVTALGGAGPAQAKRHESGPSRGASDASGASGSAIGTVGLSSLPAEAAATYRLILAGGPFPYPKDGVVFGNREHLLPAKPRGFYHEYTVRTLAAHDRGARRIVCGGKPPSRPQTCFYTADHYASFQAIAR